MIPVFKPSMGEEEINSVIEVLKSGWLGLGPKTAEFEKNFAAYVGSRHATGVNSGTAALHLALNVAGIGAGDEVIVPTITFISTPHAVVYQRARPVFADVERDTLCISTKDIKNKITSRTRAIIPVHYGGHPCDMDKIHKLARKHDLTVIEDAAHACGAEYRGKKIGSLSNLTCFSFHAVKNLACGEGGMITTDDEEYARILKELYWLGINKTTHKRSVDDRIYAWQYWVNRLGFKAHLNDISSAIGLVQLKRLKAMNDKRRYIVERYNEAFSGIGYIQTPVEKKNVKSSWHIYHLKTEKRDDLIAYLKDMGIAPGVHYYPNHLHPYYSKGRHKCPVADDVWKRIISLPLYPDMTDRTIDKVIKAVRDFDVVSKKRSVRIDGQMVRLRMIGSSDLPLMLRWRNKKANREWFFTQDKITKESQEEWYDRYLADRSDNLYIIEKGNGNPVGTIGLSNIDEKNRQAELGRMLIGDAQNKGKGYALDATKTLLGYSFRSLKLNRVYLEVFSHNTTALAMYKRAGFQEEGILREAVSIDGKWLNITRMSILKSEFSKLSSKNRDYRNRKRSR